MMREQRHGWTLNVVRLAPIGFMLRRPGAVVRVETPGQRPAGPHALGAGVRGLGAMLLWALSVRQADGGTRVIHQPLPTSIPTAERPPALAATRVTPWLRPAPVAERPALADDMRATHPLQPMPQRSVVMNSVVTNRTERIRSQPDHESSRSEPAAVAPDVWHINQSPRPAPRDRGPSDAANIAPSSVPLTVAERLVTTRIRATHHRRQVSIYEPRWLDRSLLPPLSSSALPVMVSPPAGYERPETGPTEHLANAAPRLAPALAPLPDAVVQRSSNLRPDGGYQTGSHALRRSLAGELTSLVDTITRTVEERIERQMTQPTVVPVVASSPRLPTAEEAYQLTQAEQRERAFRMGR